ncbi:hypothetical protein WA026_018627 [Henosepilachna vigintioctopunctata]|uniref:RZZ complex subunit KNTC1/ROD C-terminal domain-containing protein n=1 Tax=Henosepilachna vigintioctopunctata TaxID=420089 RepID=A0AAW1U3L3_9CUCU
MSLQIKCGFNVNDETLNFGNRGLADNECYEAVTLATVRRSEISDGVPFVNTSLKNGEIFYSINNVFGIFKDKTYSGVKFSSAFECNIDMICISPNNIFSFIFLRDGALQILKFFQEEYNLVDTVLLVQCEELPTKKLFIGGYIESFEDNDKLQQISLIVVTETGCIHRVNIIDGENFSATSELLHNLNTSLEVSSFDRSLLFLKGSRIWVIDLLKDTIISYKAMDIKYACFANMFILALLNTGEIVYIDPYTLKYILVEMDTRLHAISVLVDERSTVECIIGETVKNESNESYLQLYQQDFSVVYSIKVSNDIHIITPESVTDEVHYISFIKSETHIDEVRFHCVYETDPEKRLFRLFRRKMFDEAERYAKTHNIDVSIVNKEKAKLIVEKMECSSKDIDDLIEIFNCLSDKEFILDCCIDIESSCLNADDIMRILKYGSDLKIDKNDMISKNKKKNCNELYARINLFVAAGYKMNEWVDFSTCCLVREMKKLLKQKEISKAIIIWSRMYIQKMELLDQESVKNILDLLDFLDLDVAIPFLPTFVPITLDYLPNTLPLFVNWLEMKIFSIEDKYKDNFPQNAIDFLQDTAKYFKIGKPNVQASEESKSVKLKKLSEALNYLKTLKCNYGIKIGLKELMQEPKSVIKVLLNLELSPDMYNLVLQEFTYKFIVQNQLNADEILWDELIDILNCHESYWENIVGSILNCIHSVDLRLEAVEKIFLTAKLPWSNIVRQLGIQMLKSTYPTAFAIEKLMKEEPRMIVLKKKEYCLSRYSCTNLDDLQFLVNRIIKCDLPTLISDAFQLCGEEELFKIEVIRLLFHHFVEKGMFGKAFEVVNMNKVVIEKSLQLILNDIANLIAPSNSENYIYTLKMMTQKFNSSSKHEFKIFGWRQDVELLQNIQNVNLFFNIKVSDISLCEERKKELIRGLTRKMIENYEDDSITSETILDSCNRLSSYTGIEKEKILLQCCIHEMEVDVKKHKLLCIVAEDYLINTDKVKYLCILTVYLLHNLSIKCENQLIENSFIGYTDSNLTENNDSINIIELALSLISKAVKISDIEELPACMKIVPWVNSIYFLRRNKITMQQRIDNFGDTKDFGNFNPSTGSLLAIQKVFSMYTSFVVKYKNDEDCFLTYFNRNNSCVSQEELLNELLDFERLMYALNQSGESLLLYKLLTTLQNQFMVYEELNIVKDTLTEMIKKHCIHNLVQTSVLKNDIDENLFYTSLLWCDSKEAEKHIEQALKLQRKTPSKVAVIANIGVKIFDFHQNMSPRNFCKQVMLSVSWWEKLKHLNLDYNKFFKVNSRARLELLIETKDFDFKHIKQYCVDYHLTEIQYFYLEYLKTCLIKWKPNYKIVENNTGGKNLIVQPNQEQQLCEKCMEVKQYIEENEKVEELLQKIWSQVNFYHYEVFSCILYISEGHSFKHLKAMLSFLKKYERISLPSDIEKEKWFNSFPDNQFIDPLSEFRLLFNSTLLDSKDIWNVIRKEISLQNYSVWFEAVQAFNYLTIDDICSFLVKELVSQGVLTTIKPGEWLYPQQTGLFTEIDNCLKHMDNVKMKKFTAAYYLLSNTPEGADQVTIAKITYKYALEYKNIDPQSPNIISFKKIEKKYQRCLSLQVLHMHQLTDQRYIDLILNIEQLLMALYQDERIIKQTEYIDLYCPDINKAADELAEIFNLDIYKFRKRLISAYLKDSDSLGIHGNVSMELSDNWIYSDNFKNSKHNLLRAAYVCSSNVIFWQKYLLEQGDISNTDFADVYYRSRCLKCLLEIANESQIESLTSLDFQSYMTIVDQLTLSSTLSTFGIMIDLENMKSWSIVTNKLAQIGNPDSIKALADVCKVLKLSKAKYWEFIIKNATHFNMFSELEEYLNHTKKQDYIHDSFYVSAWQQLIDHTVTSTLNLNDEKFEEKFLKDMFMIQQCPVIHMLDLECTFKKVIQANKLGAAAILMQYLPKENAVKIANDIKKNYDLGNLLKTVEKFEALGVAAYGVRRLLLG